MDNFPPYRDFFPGTDRAFGAEPAVKKSDPRPRNAGRVAEIFPMSSRRKSVAPRGRPEGYHRVVRRIVLPAIACALLAVAAAASTAGTRPVVRVPDLRPFTVRGNGFRPHEHVRLVVQLKRTFRREVDASASGSFRVVFRRLRLPGCRAYFVRATGEAGSRATTKNTLEACGPAPGPIG
jgi:hypothetical protein